MKTITISGIIGLDATPDQLRDALKAAGGESVEILISSPGGFVSDGLEMFNLIRNYAGHTTARLSGYAMSMASYIPLAAKRIIAEDNAVYMIHNARGGVYGDHNDIAKYAETTKAISGLLARAYAKRTGKSLDDVQALMDAESYFFGQDMVDHGFIDEVIASGDDIDAASAVAFASVKFGEVTARMNSDVQAVKNDLSRMAALHAHHQPAKPATPTTGGHTMNLEQLKANHPDLVAALVAEALTGMITAEQQTAAVSTARTEGAGAEIARINAVRACAIPGHEALIETMAFDGKSTAADTALAIVAAEQKGRTAAAAALDQEAGVIVPPAEGGEGGAKTIKRAAFNALSQEDRRGFFADGGKIVD